MSTTKTNLINNRGELSFNDRKSILCGLFRGCEVILEKHNDTYYKMCIEDCHIKGFFVTVKVATTEEELFDYYLSTCGSIGR